MFNQIIDIISRDRDKRKILIVFFIKIFLTFLISIEVFKMIYGQFSIIALTDYSAFVDFLLNGTALKSFVIFSLTWMVSFFIPSTILNILAVKASTAIFKSFEYIISNPKEIEEEVKNNKRFSNFFRKVFLTLNSFDVIEISKKHVCPGRLFYKFYDYLVELESDNKSVEKGEFSDYLSITIQLFILNFWFDLNLVDYNWLTWIISILALLIIVIFLFSIYSLLSLIELKHSRILNLMEYLDPSIKNDELKESENKETNSEKTSSKPTSKTK